MPSILIVDDLVSIHEMLEAVVQPSGLTTAFATDGQQALEKYQSHAYDLVLTDVDMKPMDGISLLKKLKAYDPSSVVIIMTAYASTTSAIQALKLGAFDYIQKPFKVDELQKTLRRATEFRQFNKENPESGAVTPEHNVVDIESRIIGNSPAIDRLIQQLKKLVGAKTPVLLQGEPGTGKRAVAEILHNAGKPGKGKFVRVDCTHGDDETFRTSLIGEHGTGGEWVEEANGGSLFLDNIPALLPGLQKELVGMLKSVGQDFRLICSSALDLESLVDEGKFDDELFYRVASLPVVLPALRDRAEDIPLLVKDIAQKTVNPSFSASQIEFTEDAMQTLNAHYWPGNLSELNQVVSKVVSTTESKVISSRQLPMRLRELADWPNLQDYLQGQRNEYVSVVLHACQNDKARAAQILKCDPVELDEKAAVE